ncbi:hypothetical protein E2C01_057772 [Portunus trituberculatus]|uniref:Uncharacterized protein n=1 Tax=Portunus trituberculatus TaxID=210409 RepID=A0A5B7GTW1_PORTR|nr:hypothetical protein [Portunus trituberculatus]
MDARRVTQEWRCEGQGQVSYHAGLVWVL